MPSVRDMRNFRKGYQEALVDMANALDLDGVTGAVEWIKNNGDAQTREHAANLMLWTDQ